MRKTRKILSLILSIAMLASMFTFAMPTTASAAISKTFDGSKTLWINKTGEKVDFTFGHGGIGGKAQDDVSGYLAVKKGVEPSAGGDCYFDNPWSGSTASGNRALIALDVYFTAANTQLCFEYHRTYEKEDGTVATAGMNNFVHIGTEYGIKRDNAHLPVVPENAPTSLELNKWYNIAVEVANDGTKEVNIYINGEKYACQMHDVTIKAHRFRMNMYRGGMYFDNYYCNDDTQEADMYAEENFAMDGITVAESDKFTYDAVKGQFALVDPTLTAGELKAAISSDYEVELYENASCKTVLEDTDAVTISTVAVVNDNSKVFRYYDFYRENDTVFKYVPNGDGVSCTVTGYKDDCIPEEGSELVIPDTIAGYPVTAIADAAFMVGKYNSYSGNCVKLSSITMPDTVKTIGACAFYDTYAKITAWPADLVSIGANAFEHGGNMPGKFPAGFKHVGQAAFRFSSLGADILAIELPDGMETIEKEAFWWCGSVKKLVIPDSVTSLGDNFATLMYARLNTIRFPRNDTITELPAGSISAGNYTKRDDRLLGNISIYIPETITTIPDDLVRDIRDGATVTIYGEYGSPAYEYYEKIKAELAAGTYTNLATYPHTEYKSDGTTVNWTNPEDKDGDGKGELAEIKFVDYNFETNTDYDSTGTNKGDATPSVGTKLDTTTVTVGAAGMGGKLESDVVIELDTKGGTGGQNFVYIGSAEGENKPGVYYHEINVTAPAAGYVGVQFGTFSTSDLKNDPDGDGVNDGFYNGNPDAWKVTNNAIYVMGTKVADAVAGRWYTIATEIACDGGKDIAVYVNGERHEAELDKDAYGVRHFRVYPGTSTESYKVYYDNLRAYRSTSRNYNPLGDIPATVTSKSDDIAVHRKGIVYANEEAVYTAGELLDMLEVDAFSRANVRIYSNATYKTQLADTDNVTNDSVVVVAATNGFDMERVYSYYPINPPVNTTIFDIAIIDEGAKTAKVTGFLEDNITEIDDLSAIAIPETIMGYTITEIGEKAFYLNTEIQSVVIPDTVEKIGNLAFGNDFADGKSHGNISSVKMSKNIKEIGEGAFKCNNSLKEIELPEGLETIGASAFYWTGLRSISLPNSLTSLGSQAFRLCQSLNYLKLSSGINEYTDQFYSNGLPLKDLIVPANVTTIGELALTDLSKYSMDLTVYGIRDTYAQSYAEANGWDFVNIIANTIVAKSDIYGDDSKALAGTDYDIRYGYEKFTFKGELINVGKADTDANLIIALYDDNDAILAKTIKPVTIPEGKTVVIDETSGVSIDVDTALADGYKVKAFVWKASNNEPIADAIEVLFDADKREIHVLHIANSFGNDSFGYINSIAKADGITLKVQNMYIGGAPLTSHYKNMKTNAANYQPNINGGSSSDKISVNDALVSDKWDVVALQCASHGFSSDYSFVDYATWSDDAKGTTTGTPNVTTGQMYEFIKDYVAERAPQAKRIMHMSWSPCEAQSKVMYGERFKDSEDARGAMFELQKEAYLYGSSIYADEEGMMVPSSYAVQYALNVLGYKEHSGEKAEDNTYPNPVAGEVSIYRDETCHLTLPYGRVLAGLTWYEYLTGNDARENKYTNSSIPADIMAKLKEAAHWANQQVVGITGSDAE